MSEKEKQTIKTMADIFSKLPAINKQIPKKPAYFTIANNDGYTIYDCECPSCEQSHRELFPFAFCIHCGQKIDWGDIK